MIFMLALEACPFLLHDGWKFSLYGIRWLVDYHDTLVYLSMAVYFYLIIFNCLNLFPANARGI